MADEITDDQAIGALERLAQENRALVHAHTVLTKFKEAKETRAKIEKETEALLKQNEHLRGAQRQYRDKAEQYDKECKAEMDGMAANKELAKKELSVLQLAVEKMGRDLENLEVEKQQRLADMNKAIAAEQAKLDKVSADVNKYVNRLTAARPG